MNDYGTGIGGGSVLGAATALPATGIAADYAISGTSNNTIVFGVFLVVLVSFLVNLTMIARFLLNSRRK